VLLAIAARYLNLTNDDLVILGPIALILAGVFIRAGVSAPATVERLLDGGDRQGAPGEQRPQPRRGTFREPSRPPAR
jgi:hypothetical protein